jgi:hypothetical protein
VPPTSRHGRDLLVTHETVNFGLVRNISLSKSRIFGCQGTSQLLYILAVMDFLDSESPGQEFDNYLIIGGLGHDDQELIRETYDLITVMATHKRKWSVIAPWSEFSEYLPSNSGIVELFLTRDIGDLASSLLTRYPSAPLFIFGDMQEIELVRKENSGRDLRYLCIEPFFVSGSVHRNIRIASIDSMFLQSVIATCAELLMERQDVKSLLAWSRNCSGPLTLVPLSMLTELLLCKNTDEEVLVYHNLLKRRVACGDFLILKAHPRSTNGQDLCLQAVLKLLHQANPIVLDKTFQLIPTEVLIKMLDITSVVGPWSSVEYLNSDCKQSDWRWSDLSGTSFFTRLNLFRLQLIVRKTSAFYRKVNAEGCASKSYFKYSYYGKQFPFQFLSKVVRKLRFELRKWR